MAMSIVAAARGLVKYEVCENSYSIKRSCAWSSIRLLAKIVTVDRPALSIYVFVVEYSISSTS